MATNINGRLPPEIVTMILAHAISPPQLHPSGRDSLVNDLKFCTDDCELAAEYVEYTKQRTYSSVIRVCHLWNDILLRFPRPSEQWIVLHEEEGSIPFASRVHYPKSGGCQCHLSGCPIRYPPPHMDKARSSEPIKAFVESRLLTRDTGKIITEEATLIRGIAGQGTSIQDLHEGESPILHPDLRVLAFAPDFTSATPFSLPNLSAACPNLTHLWLSEFFLPEDGRDQTLDLPHLRTLTLDFWHQEDSPVDDDQEEGAPNDRSVLHSSIERWNLPALRHLGLKGWISEPNSPLFNDINKFLEREGHKLDGLLYDIWTLSETGVNIPQSASPHLLERCPKLRSIQIPLSTLITGPVQPSDHPRLTVTPVCFGDFDRLQDMGWLLWPIDVYHRLSHPGTRSIERFCASTTWATFHRELLRIDREGMLRHRFEQPSDGPGYWREYFREWIYAAMGIGYTLEDRYGVDIREGSGRELLCWLGVPIDGESIMQGSVYMEWAQ